MGISLDNINASLHSIAISDGTDTLAITAAGEINAIIADGGGSITVDGTVAATQSGTWNIGTVASITADVNIADGGNSITVDAVDLDIRALDHVTIGDSVRIGDGVETLAINADGSVNASTVPGGFSSWQVTVDTVDTTAGGVELTSTPLASRLKLIIQNLGSQDVYLKEATGVTTANGIELAKGSSFEAQLDDTANIWGIVGSGTSDVRIAEFAS